MRTSGPADDPAHRALRELLGAYALGKLPAQEQPALQAHLDGCAACRAELAELAPLGDTLRLVDPDDLVSGAAPPADLGGLILRQIGQERQLRDRRARRARLVAAAAGLVAAVLLAGGAGAVLVDRDPDRPAVPTETVALVAQQPGLDVRSAVLVPHTWGLEVTVVLTGLRQGERYRAVALDRDGRQLPAGEFLGVADRPAECDLQAALLRQDARGFLLLDSAGGTVASADLSA